MEATGTSQAGTRFRRVLNARPGLQTLFCKSQRNIGPGMINSGFRKITTAGSSDQAEGLWDLRTD